MTSEKEIFNHLYELGCCKYCCMRYLCVRTPGNYTDLETNVLNKNEPLTDAQAEQIIKKTKTTACVVCLGLLQELSINSVVDKVALSDQVSSYDSSKFTCSVSYPPCIYVREHSIRLHLEKQYPDFFTFDRLETQLNKVWKWIIKDKLAKKINKEFESSETCDFSINITMAYEQNADELAVLLNMQPNLFSIRKTQHRKYRGELFSRKGVLTALGQTKPCVFREHAPVPPEAPTQAVSCTEITCSHNSIYIAGRYCKFSRELSQSPWIINGVKTMEHSVQEIIFEPVRQLLSVPLDGLKFSSSGREDVDVRCLGNGRPFVLECMNPKKTNINVEELRGIEFEINKSPMLDVRDLQVVTRDELTHIKDGEESKTKEYEALCICKVVVTPELIAKINEWGPVQLQQKTPIRVLHRRPLAVRSRTIHSMTAELLPDKPNIFKLKLRTQAGTYVKEFIHGDFGRTKPNIGTIMGVEVDIIALDVIAINLDWPRRINYT